MSDPELQRSTYELTLDAWKFLRSPGGDPRVLYSLAKELKHRSRFGLARRLIERAREDRERKIDSPLLSLELLLLQPGLQRRREAEAGLNQATLGSLSQQARNRTAKQRIKRIQKDRLTSAGFTGEHREPLAEIQLEMLDQRNVVEAQSRQHHQLPDRTDVRIR